MFFTMYLLKFSSEYIVVLNIESIFLSISLFKLFI